MVALIILSFATWSNFLHGNEAPSNHSFYDKFILVATYLIKKRQKNNNNLKKCSSENENYHIFHLSLAKYLPKDAYHI